MEEYIYRGLPERKAAPTEVLPPGDYDFEVLSHEEPYRNENNRWVLKVKLGIKGKWVFAQTWTGQTGMGEERDGIGEFLVAINRAPKRGTAPDWYSVDGAHGRCRIKIGIAGAGKLAGQEINQVSFFFAPKALSAQEPAAPSAKKPTPKLPQDLDREPDDIPF